jgi:hypothetical protein
MDIRAGGGMAKIERTEAKLGSSKRKAARLVRPAPE